MIQLTLLMMNTRLLETCRELELTNIRKKYFASSWLFTRITDLHDVEVTEYCDQEVQRGLCLEDPCTILSHNNAILLGAFNPILRQVSG